MTALPPFADDPRRERPASRPAAEPRYFGRGQPFEGGEDWQSRTAASILNFLSRWEAESDAAAEQGGDALGSLFRGVRDLLTSERPGRTSIAGLPLSPTQPQPTPRPPRAARTGGSAEPGPEQATDSWAVTGRGAGRLDGRGPALVEYDYEAELRKVARMSPEDRARLQTQMVLAGVLEGDFQYGGWDEPTIAAYSDLLGFSELHQLPVDKALTEYGAARRWAEEQGIPWGEMNGGRGDPGGVEQMARRMRRRFVRPTYEAPDLANLADAVDAEFERQVGRPPTQRERDEWSQRYAQAHRVAFEEEVAATRREHEFSEDTAMWGDRVAASQEARAAGPGGAAQTTADIVREQAAGPQDSWMRNRGVGDTSPPGPPSPGAPPSLPGEVQTTDPLASFQAALSNYLGVERRGQEQAEGAADAQRLVSGVFAGIGARMRGGG